MVDLLIIGAGPGGYEAALEARKHGLSVTMFDERPAGGTCLWVGCIPSKAMHHVAENYRGIAQLQALGQPITVGPVDLKALWAQKNNAVHTLAGDVSSLLQNAGVEVKLGHAQLTDDHHILCNGVLYEGKNILLASGSFPFMPPINGINLPGVLDSNHLLSLQTLPASLIVVGGGYIGLEWAFILRSFGVKVTIIEVLPSLLTIADEDVSKRILVFAKKEGIEVLLNVQIGSFEKTETGMKVNLTSDPGRVLEAEKILVATGRRPRVEGLGLDKAGVQYSPRGIVVNALKQTSVPHIYAVGDCIGNPMLAHKASFEGRQVAMHLAGIEFQPDYSAIPAAVFTFPEIASVGLTEADVRAKGITYETKRIPLRANCKAVASDQTDGFFKIIYDANKVLLGAHLMAPQASVTMHEVAILFHAKKPLTEWKNVIHAHPTLSEIVQTMLQSL